MSSQRKEGIMLIRDSFFSYAQLFWLKKTFCLNLFLFYLRVVAFFWSMIFLIIGYTIGANLIAVLITFDKLFFEAI